MYLCVSCTLPLWIAQNNSALIREKKKKSVVSGQPWHGVRKEKEKEKKKDKKEEKEKEGKEGGKGTQKGKEKERKRKFPTNPTSVISPRVSHVFLARTHFGFLYRIIKSFRFGKDL